MRELYDHLRKHVPLSATALSDSSSRFLLEHRMELLRQHRRIAMAPDLHDQARKPGRDLLKFVLSPVEAESPVSISPTYMQHCIRFLDHCHDHIDDCARALLFKPKSKTFRSLCVGTIPSLFGYFSSAEHINLAVKFYIGILTRADAAVGSRVLEPFFSGPGLYRFLESWLKPFIELFLRDSRPLTDPAAKGYAIELSKAFLQDSRLIPQAHRVLLRLMKMQWGGRACADFLFGNVLTPTVLSWFRVMSRRDVKGAWSRILRLMPTMELTTEVCLGESAFEVPFQYVVYDDPFLLFLVSPEDIRALHALMLRVDAVPALFRCLGEEKIQPNVVFWARTYPRYRPTAFDTCRRFIFNKVEIQLPPSEEFERRWRSVEELAASLERDPYEVLSEKGGAEPEFLEYALNAATQRLAENADQFENYLFYCHHIKVTEQWMAICDSHEGFVLSPLFSLLAETSKAGGLKKTFDKASELIQSRANKQFLFLVVLKDLIPPEFRPASPEFSQFEAKWKAFLQSVTPGLERWQGNASQTKSAIFFEAVEQLQNLDYEELPFQFRSLMQALRLLHHLAAPGEPPTGPITTAIVISAGVDKLISVFFSLVAWAMERHDFEGLCLPHEILLWSEFNDAMFSLLMRQEQLSQMFIYLHENCQRLV
jgi:hypothetical protein